jgi:hypothetical protein
MSVNIKIIIRNADQEQNMNLFQNEINVLKMDFTSNKNKVIEYLIDNVLDVDLSIPAV